MPMAEGSVSYILILELGFVFIAVKGIADNHPAEPVMIFRARGIVLVYIANALDKP